MVDDGGADELAGDAAAEELGDIVEDGGADAGDVQVEGGLAHQHHGALEPSILARQVADDPSDNHLCFTSALFLLARLFSGERAMCVVLCDWS